MVHAKHSGDSMVKPTLRGTRCEDCPFKTPLCGTKGPEDSPFVIVGESPGTNEIRAGKPFVGESGKLLETVLAQAGFAHLGIEPYYINALDCYPPPSAKSGTKGRDLMRHATNACRGRVLQQLQKHPRQVILTLGAAASWSVTGDSSIAITRARGQILESPYAKKGVVLTVHPAFLMRNGAYTKVWKQDIRQAVDLLRGKEVGKWVDPTYNIIDRPSTFIDMMKEYHEADLITGDYETDALHWYGGRILCLGVTKDDGDHVDIIPEDFIYKNPKLMRRLLSSGTWAWHNAMFDDTWSNAPQHQFGAACTHDTMLMSYSLNEQRGFHDLDFVAQYWAGLPRHKGMLEKYLPYKGASYRNVPLDVLYLYNAIDLKKQHIVAPILYDAVLSDPHSNKLYHEILMPAVPELVKAKLHGVKADAKQVEKNMVTQQEELDQITAEINAYAQKHVGKDINPGSWQQLQHLLYDKMRLVIPGDRSTSEETIIKVQRRYDHPICNLILRYREVSKRKGTYVANLLPHKKGSRELPGHIRSDGVVYPDFKLHGTATGRLAGSDPNLLNQPRIALIRDQYVARAGKIFVEVDLNQAELRSLAQMSGDPTLVDIYTKNEVSIHDVTTSKFYGSKADMEKYPITLDKAITLLQYFGERDAGLVYKEAKMRGKAVNFGIVYGREAYSLAMEFNISVHEAQRLIDEWMSTYEGAAAFIKWCRKRPELGRDLITVYGRKKRHGVVSRERLKALQNEAANFPHQSTASDIMLETLIEVGPVLRERWDAWVWNEVYDAIYYEVDIDEKKVAESIAFIQGVITDIPIRRGLTRVPFLGDAKVGFKWGSMREWKGDIISTLGKDQVESHLRQRAA